MLILELPLVFATLGVIFVIVARRPPEHATRATPGFNFLERKFKQLAGQKTLSIFLVGLAVVTLRAGLIPVLGIPTPAIHDEFSYLLAADTFAHGRVTNPTPPLWQHFESYHIILRPTYMSMYPPGQGLVLALGEHLGHPWVGVLLSTALMCSAICWMLQAWLPPSWALLGGALVALRLGLLSYWMNSYWGGSLAALGGALVLGALPRLKRRPDTSAALFMAAGLAILANTRPYEGLALSAPALLLLATSLLRHSPVPAAVYLKQVAMPLALCLIATALAMGYYNQRVTGNAFRMSYEVNGEAYRSSPPFLWQQIRPLPIYNHPDMRDFYLRFRREFQDTRTKGGLLRHTAVLTLVVWLFFVGPIFSIALGFAPWALCDRSMQTPLLIGTVFLVAVWAEVWTHAHYLAPGTGLLYLILLQCLRCLWHWIWHERPIGKILVRVIPMLCFAMVILQLAVPRLHAHVEASCPPGMEGRALLLRQLEVLPEKQLVIVRYTNAHDDNHEWVYNDADLGNSKVIWARDMGQSGNQELLPQFRDRRVWLLDPDKCPFHPDPLPLAATRQ